MDGISDQPRRLQYQAYLFVGVSALLPLNDRGVDVTMGELLTTLRWASCVAVVVLIAAVVFAVFAVRGDRASRVRATVLAVLIGLFVVPLGIVGVLQDRVRDLVARAAGLRTLTRFDCRCHAGLGRCARCCVLHRPTSETTSASIISHHRPVRTSVAAAMTSIRTMVPTATGRRESAAPSL